MHIYVCTDPSNLILITVGRIETDIEDIIIEYMPQFSAYESGMWPGKLYVILNATIIALVGEDGANARITQYMFKASKLTKYEVTVLFRIEAPASISFRQPLALASKQDQLLFTIG